MAQQQLTLSRMSTSKPSIKPAFVDALRAWKEFLGKRNLPVEVLWIFGENLYFEKDPAVPRGFRLGFQTVFAPPPPEAERIAYEHFVEFDAPIVFYRMGTSRGRSVCILLADVWFRGKNENDGYAWPHPDWELAFHAGEADAIEEITNENRWKNRLLRERPLHDLDFCMDLRGIHEILAHGRVLSTYEHYALKLLHLWRQIFEHRR